MRFAAGERGVAVETHRELHTHPRATTFDARKESTIERACLRFHQSDFDHDAGRAQHLEALAVDVLERVATRRNHARDAGLHQVFCARRRASRVCARFERHVCGRAARAFARFAQREHFGVRLAGALVEPFADNVIAVRDHTANHRVRLGRVGTALGKPQRTRHHRVIGG